VIERGGPARFAPQAFRNGAAHRGSREHDFERNGTPERDIQGLEHGRHAAPAAFALNLVFATEHKSHLRQQRIVIVDDECDGLRCGVCHFLPTQAAKPQARRDTGIAAAAGTHVPVAVNVRVGRPDTAAVTVLGPGLGPSVSVISASPLALVSTLTWDAPMLPPPTPL
jgi:hypothetical protein